MSKRILVNNMGEKQISKNWNLTDTIRIYSYWKGSSTGLYAVIIADDNTFEGL